MKKLIYTINNKNYVLFEASFPMTSQAENLIERAHELGGIIQGFDVKSTGFFSKRCELSFLIPEENSRKFSSINNID